MAGQWDLTGQNIENTYQRVLQTPDGTNFYDGTGSAVTFTATAAAGGSNTQIQFNSASLLSGSSNFSFNYVSSSVILTGSFDFNAAVNTIPNQAGRFHWNDTDGTLELGLKGGVVTSLLGQGLVTRIVNKTVPNIDLLSGSYQAVVVGGAQGQRLAIRLALADKDATSAGTLGLVAEDIPKNQEGFIVTVGLLKNRDTTGALQGETWNDGDVLYLSPTTAGAITNIKPQAPQHTVIIGYVEYAHQNNGKIYVKIDNGYELDELHNVRITTASLSTGDLLMYDSGSALWKNSKTLSGSYTLSGSLTTNDGISIQSLTASFVSASSITGSLFGTASIATVANNVSIIANNTTNSTYYLPFTDRLSGTAQTGSVQLQTDTSIGYNPSSNTLTVSQLNGNALTATNATNATTAATASSVAQLNQNVVITGSLTVVTGSSIELRVTNTGVTIGNSITDIHTITGSLSVSGSITGSLFGTASWATNTLTASFLPVGTYNITSSWTTNALTASYTPNALVTASVSSNVLTFTKGNGSTFNLTVDTGSGGGGGTPGGGNTSIQFRSGSTFSGNTRLTYQYDTLSATSNRLYHEYNEDFRSNRFTTDYRGSYLPNNTYGGIKQYAGISHWSYQLAANAPKSPIYAFDAQGGTPGNLSMHGFKCDYSLLLFDGSSKIASRVGTLIGAWSYDTAITPVIQDNYVDGDQVYNELGTVLFTLTWSGGDIILEMDCTSVNSGTTYFNGLFTNFGNGL